MAFIDTTFPEDNMLINYLELVLREKHISD